MIFGTNTEENKRDLVIDTVGKEREERKSVGEDGERVGKKEKVLDGNKIVKSYNR